MFGPTSAVVENIEVTAWRSEVWSSTSGRATAPGVCGMDTIYTEARLMVLAVDRSSMVARATISRLVPSAPILYRELVRTLLVPGC